MAAQRRSGRKDKHRKIHSSSGNEHTSVNISLWHGCELIWTKKTGLRSQHFGALFVESTREGYADKKTFLRHGSMALPITRPATSPITPVASNINHPCHCFVSIKLKVSTSRLLPIALSHGVFCLWK